MSFYIKKHWNGELKLWQLFWLNTILVFMALQTVLIFIQATIHDQSTHKDIRQYTTFIILWFLLSTAILVWQIIGNLRGNHRSQKPLLNIGRITKNLTLFFLAIILSLQILLHLPTTIHYVKIVLNKDKLSKTAAQIKIRNNTVKIEGSIDFNLPDRLSKLLNDNPEIKSLTINSAGGYMPPARKIAHLIINKKLDTHINKTCNSACTYIFAAGTKRTISINAKLGFHSPSVILISPWERRERYLKDMRYLENRGIKTGFIEKIYQTHHSKLWFPDHKELINSGYLTNTTGSTSR